MYLLIFRDRGRREWGGGGRDRERMSKYQSVASSTMPQSGIKLRPRCVP